MDPYQIKKSKSGMTNGQTLVIAVVIILIGVFLIMNPTLIGLNARSNSTVVIQNTTTGVFNPWSATSSYPTYNTVNNAFGGTLTTPGFVLCPNIASVCQTKTVTAGTQDTNGIAGPLGFVEFIQSQSSTTNDAYPVIFQTDPTGTGNGCTIQGIGCIAPGMGSNNVGGTYAPFAGASVYMSWQPNTAGGGQWAITSSIAQTPHTCGTTFSGGSNGLGVTSATDTAANLVASTTKNCQLALSVPGGATSLSTSPQTFTWSVLDGVAGTVLDQTYNVIGTIQNPVTNWASGASGPTAASPAAVVGQRSGVFILCMNQTGVQVSPVSGLTSFTKIGTNLITAGVLCYAGQTVNSGITPSSATTTSRQDILDIKVNINENSATTKHIGIVGFVVDNTSPNYTLQYLSTPSTITCAAGTNFCNNQTNIVYGTAYSTFGLAASSTYGGVLMPTSGNNAGSPPEVQLLSAGVTLAY